MRTLLFLTFLFGIVSCSNSQRLEKDFTTFYNQYQDDEGVVSFSIPTALAKAFIDDDDEEANKVFKKVNKLRFFICDNDNGYYSKKITSYLSEDVYHDLMVIKDGKGTVFFKMKAPEDDEIKEVIMTVSDAKGSFVAISFCGRFTLEDAKEMTSSIKTDNVGTIRM